MDLYLLRHGPAAEREQWHGDDRLRPLTPKGRRRTRAVAGGLKALGLQPDCIVASPYVRAQQTAAIAAKVFGVADIATARALAPQARPAAMARGLAPLLRATQAPLLVGHEPSLSRFASWLLRGDDTVALRLRKAGLLHVECTELAAATAVLRRLLDPDDAAACRT